MNFNFVVPYDALKVLLCKFISSIAKIAIDASISFAKVI